VILKCTESIKHYSFGTEKVRKRKRVERSQNNRKGHRGTGKLKEDVHGEWLVAISSEQLDLRQGEVNFR